MSGNPWDNDPIVSAAAPAAAAPNPWDKDPIISSAPPIDPTEITDEDSPEAAEAKALGVGSQVLAHQIVGGTLGVAGKAAGRLADLATGTPNNRSESWGAAGGSVMAPTTEQGQLAEQALGQAASYVTDPIKRGAVGALSDVVGEPAAQSGVEGATELGQYVLLGKGALEGIPKLANVGGSTQTISRFGQPLAPPKLTPGPITAAELRTAPDRLPPPTPEAAPAAIAPPPPTVTPTRVPVPGKPHIRPLPAPPEPAPTAAEAAARIRAEGGGGEIIKGMEEPGKPQALSEPGQATTPVTPMALAAPARDESEIAGTAPTQAQAERVGAIRQLQQDTGAVMPSVRQSAVTGDYRETGTDYQLAELGDPTMRTQIDQENAALRAGSQAQVDSAGGVARGVGQAALEQRGGIIDRALQGIGDWFDRNIRQLYQNANRAAGGVPMSKFDNLQGLLNDHSQFTGVEGKQLHADIMQTAKQFGMLGEDGFWKPTTVATSEWFRQWLGEQYTPRTGRTIARAKDALDADVSAHGGQGLYDAARALRTKRDQMLEGPTGIRRLMPEKLPDGSLINRPVPLEKIADHITNLPREQFDHIVNVLHDSSKLGRGELAENNAAALNEIRRHMAERLHEAGTGGRDGMWNPYDYHEQLDHYSTKLPSVFSPEGIRRFNTIHDAGNALRLNKRYPGAAKQIMQAGGLRALAAPRIAGLVEGTLTGFLGPAGGAAVEATGLAPALRKGIERVVVGNQETRQARQVGERLQPLSVGPGAKQRGGPKFENNASGESSASAEAQSRVRQETAAGRFRYQIDPDGNVTPLRGVDAVDAKAPAGHVIVQRGIGLEPYTVLDRGGLPAAQAHGRVARAQGLGKFKEFEQPLGQTLFGGKQRGGPKFTPKNETPLEGAPPGDRPNGAARGAAAAYMRSTGRDYQPLTDYRYVQPEVAKNVADAYDAMKHDPTNPKVKAAYDAFKAETLAQYKQMQKAGVKVTLDPDYPYKVPREVHEDVRANNHMSIFPTESGFGAEGAVASDHPLVERAPIRMGGQPATYNDLFRAVHDYYGHVAEGNGFRANGEYNAWRAHRTMYSDAARPAMDSETLGQNSWVNSGPHAEANKGASAANTVYAEQKAGLLPPKVVSAAETGVSAEQHHVTNLLTEPERAQLRSDTTQRLMDAFRGAPATEEYSAAALAGAAKRGWYANSARAISNVFGPDGPRFSGLLAAMSPQTSIEMNFHNALRTFVNWDKAGRPTDPAAIKQIMRDSVQKKSAADPGVLPAWENNAVRALTAEDPGNIKLSGPKVHSFYSNLTDKVNEVTNDAWMATFAKLGDVQKLGGSLNQSGPGKSSTYLAFSAKVRAAAKQISSLTGETWTPREVQETVWSWAKTAYEHAEELGDKTIPELVKHGNITDELIRSTPDFHQLFSTPEHRGFLESSRFAGNAERMATGEGERANTTNNVKARAAAAKTLRPHLLSAARRLESVRQERAAVGTEEAPF